jgi:hypothetical protein
MCSNTSDGICSIRRLDVIIVTEQQGASAQNARFQKGRVWRQRVPPRVRTMACVTALHHPPPYKAAYVPGQLNMYLTLSPSPQK